MAQIIALTKSIAPSAPAPATLVSAPKTPSTPKTSTSVSAPRTPSAPVSTTPISVSEEPGRTEVPDVERAPFFVWYSHVVGAPIRTGTQTTIALYTRYRDAKRRVAALILRDGNHPVDPAMAQTLWRVWKKYDIDGVAAYDKQVISTAPVRPTPGTRQELSYAPIRFLNWASASVLNDRVVHGLTAQQALNNLLAKPLTNAEQSEFFGFSTPMPPEVGIPVSSGPVTPVPPKPKPAVVPEEQAPVSAIQRVVPQKTPSIPAPTKTPSILAPTKTPSIPAQSVVPVAQLPSFSVPPVVFYGAGGAGVGLVGSILLKKSKLTGTLLGAVAGVAVSFLFR